MSEAEQIGLFLVLGFPLFIFVIAVGFLDWKRMERERQENWEKEKRALRAEQDFIDRMAKK